MLEKTLNLISHSFRNPLSSSARPEKGFCSGVFPRESVFVRTAAVTRAVICASVSAILENFFVTCGGTGGTDECDGPAVLVVQSGNWVSTGNGNGIGVRKAGGLYLWSPSWRSQKRVKNFLAFLVVKNIRGLKRLLVARLLLLSRLVMVLYNPLV